MYASRPGYGGQLPYSLGERSGAPFNLSGVSEAGYGPYLGDFFNDVAGVAQKVGLVAGELSKVNTGRATVATVPTGYASLTVPMGGSPVSTAIPLWVIGAGAGLLLFMAFRKR